MRFIKNQLALWRIALIIGVAAFAIPIAARVRVATKAQVDEQQDYWSSRVERRLNRRQEYLDSQTGDDDADDKDTKDKKDDADDDDDTVDQGVEAQQDVYERRRDYYRQRLEREW